MMAFLLMLFNVEVSKIAAREIFIKPSHQLT